MTDEHYDLDYHRAMEAAYQRQISLHAIEVYAADYERFNKLCRRHNQTMAQMFHKKGAKIDSDVGNFIRFGPASW